MNRACAALALLCLVGCGPGTRDDVPLPGSGPGGGTGFSGGTTGGFGGSSTGGFSGATAGPGGTGVVTGGAQDFGFIRARVDAGLVPKPEDFVMEGLFAEHDLPISSAPCNQLLCLDAASAVTPLADGGTEHWVQLGMTSNLDASAFQRPALDLAVVIDRSCSMAGERFDATRRALSSLADQLGPDDTLAIVQFDDAAQVVSTRAPVTDRAAVKALFDGLSIGGGTCIECGLSAGFAELSTAQASAARERRVILLTDAQPNVGGTRPADFLPMITAHAAEGRHLTAMGVGLDFGQELVSKLAATRGANFVFLADPARIASAFTQDFAFLVTPLGFDLTVAFDASPQLALSGMYGLPGVDPAAGTAESRVATLFLSRSSSGGAILARLQGALPAGDPIAELNLGFTPRGGAPVTSSLLAMAPAGPAPAYSQANVQKTIALARFLELAREACRAHYAGDAAEALRSIDEAVMVLATARADLNDPALDRELALAAQLRALF